MTEVLPVYLVRGDDPVLISEATRALVHELVGDDDPALVVEDLVGEDYEVAAVVDAAQTPPFLGARRVVVARDVGRFRTDELEPLVAYLADPLPTTALVLVAGGGQLSQRLGNAVKKTGHVVSAGPQAKERRAWLLGRLKESPLRFDKEASDLLADHLGEDVGRLGSLLEVLEAAYVDDGRVGAADLEPFLGEAGGVAPWDLTDAIDRGDVAGALVALHRLLDGGGRHPLVVLATLHTYVARMLRLDGAGLDSEKAAAQALGMSGSTFPARKALDQSRRLGHDRIVRAVNLVAEADLALKGTIEWPGELVLEVLVARLARLSPKSTRRR